MEKFLEAIDKNEKVYIFGARVACGTIYDFIANNYTSDKIAGFVVSKKDADIFYDKPILEIDELKDKNALIIVATIECFHAEIEKALKDYDLNNMIFIDSSLRQKIFLRLYPNIKVINEEDENINKSFCIYMAKGHFDKKISSEIPCETWLKPIQVGSTFTDKILSNFRDNTFDNIAQKNKTYCELTATYWIWKNVKDDYIGLCHYRRIFEMSEKNINYIKKNDIDVVLPVPIVCLPNAQKHHSYYIPESDFVATLNVLKEFYPDYYDMAKKIFSEKLFYWHNMWIMKKEVLNDYCKWLFDVLFKVEEIVDSKHDREDRCMGYIAESLTTLYFLYNKDKLKIEHVFERMLV